MKDTKSQRDHLQILGSGGRGDVPGFGADIIDDGLLEPWDEEVGAFVNNLENTVSSHKQILNNKVPL
jgi:hypothetical protein